MSIELKEHQKEAYNAVEEEFAKGNRTAVIHPTGTGKSYIALKLIEDNQGKKVLYLAPSISILHQIKENSIKQNGKMFSGLERMTYQKLSTLDSHEMRKINPDIIVLDEFHHCGAPAWGRAVSEICDMFQNAKVLGLSATPVRYFDGNINMAEEMFGGHIASEMSFSEAVEKGILPGFDYVSAMYGYEDKLFQLKENIEESNVAQTKKNEARKIFEELSKQLSKDTENLPEVLERHMTNKNGKYIVFCSTIDEMKKKIQEVQELFSKINPNVKIYSVASSENLRNNQKVLEQFEADDDQNALKLMFSVNMLNEGYHLSDIDGVIMMRPTKSPTVYMQQMGRALTVGSSSKTPVIIDLVDNFDSIRIIENATRDFFKRGESNTAKSENEEKKFRIIDYTKNIAEISTKIEELCKFRALSISNKIDLFEKFMKENPEESIHLDTVFKGYPIGQYLIQIRQAMIYDKNVLKYDDRDKARLEKLGLLYESKDTIESKVERLKAYCEKYPYAFSNIKDLIIKFEREGKKDEIEYIKNLYKSNYQYVIGRKIRGKLSEDIEQDLKKAKVGGVFGLTEEDAMLEEQYGIKSRVIVQLIQEFGSIDEFRRAYIQYKIDLTNAKTYEEIVLNNNEKVLKYIDDLPLVDDFNLSGKEGYRLLIKHVRKRNFINKGIIIIDDDINSILDTLGENERKVIELNFGLKDGKPRKISEIEKIFGLSRARVLQMELKALQKFTYTEFFDEHIYEPTEKFIRAYFNRHDVFYKKDEPQMPKKDIEELIAIWKEQIKIKHENTEPKDSNENHISCVGLSTRAINCLVREVGVKNISELLEKIETMDDWNKFRKLGKKTVEEIIEKVHSLGFKFKYEIEPQKEVTSETDIMEVGLSTRATNCLVRWVRVKNISELLEKIETMDDWKKFRTLGKKSVEEIIDKVHSLGLKFKYETKVEPEENKNNKETKSTSELLISKESEEKTEESSIVDKEVNSIDTNVEMTSQISEFENKHIEICKKVDELKSKKKHITTVIKQLLKDLNAMNSNEVGKKSETAMKEISEMIQEHKIVLQDLDKTIAKMQKIEKDIRRERNKTAENSSKIIQERE